MENVMMGNFDFGCFPKMLKTLETFNGSEKNAQPKIIAISF